MKEILEKVMNRPGFCSQKELVTAKKFVIDLKEKLELYISVTNYDPQGEQLHHLLDKIEWYLRR